VTYLSVRPDLKKVLQKGYVNPRSRDDRSSAARKPPPSFEIDRNWADGARAVELATCRALPSTHRTASGRCIGAHAGKAEDVPKRAQPSWSSTRRHLRESWGGDGAGYEWPQREHGINIDNKGFVWITGNNCPTNGIATRKPVATTRS